MYPQWPYSYGYVPGYNAQNEKKQESNALHDMIHQLFEKIDEMEKKQKKMQQQIEAIKPLTIENINYKIQDLHVDELSGSLLVGLTGLSEAEELQQLLREQSSTEVNVEADDEKEVDIENKEEW